MGSGGVYIYFFLEVDFVYRLEISMKRFFFYRDFD